MRKLKTLQTALSALAITISGCSTYPSYYTTGKLWNSWGSYNPEAANSYGQLMIAQTYARAQVDAAREYARYAPAPYYSTYNRYWYDNRHWYGAWYGYGY